MTELKMQTTMVHEIDYSDLELFIAEEYGISTDLNIPSLEGWSNDSSHTFNINPVLKTADEPDEDPEFEEAMASLYGRGTHRRAHRVTEPILMHLAWLGRIPCGNYLIRVCW
jgi:hypothetical protein